MTGGGGMECRRHDLSGESRDGGEYERGFPPSHWGVRGASPWKNFENYSAGEAFLNLFWAKYQILQFILKVSLTYKTRKI